METSHFSLFSCVTPRWLWACDEGSAPLDFANGIFSIWAAADINFQQPEIGFSSARWCNWRRSKIPERSDVDSKASSTARAQSKCSAKGNARKRSTSCCTSKCRYQKTQTERYKAAQGLESQTLLCSAFCAALLRLETKQLWNGTPSDFSGCYHKKLTWCLKQIFTKSTFCA